MPSFFSDLQTTMTGRPPPPARHNAAPAPSTLSEELLLARFVLVCRDGAQPPLSPIYHGPYRVLELLLFKMFIGSNETVLQNIFTAWHCIRAN